jgi:hypothetical protein
MTENNVNREYKNNFFVALCEDKERLIEIYNAVSNKNYPPDAAVKIITLDDVLFLGRRNDVAFTVDDDRLVVFMEHQSTVCRNMPVRLVMYTGRIYEKWLNADEKIKRAVYGMTLLKIPKPEFYVFYNGKEEFPERKDLRLSDAFLDVPGSAPEWFGGLLELIVPIYNINRGFNAELLDRSETLFGYSFVVDLVRKYEGAGYKLNEALPMAVEDSIGQGILVDFLRNHSSEVINMLTAEFNMEDAIQVWLEEGREEGREEGMEKGMEEMAEKMARNLLSRGIPLDIIAQSAGMPMEKIQILAG